MICEVDALSVLWILEQPPSIGDTLACLVDVRNWSCTLSHTLQEDNACTDELSKMGATSSYGLTILRECHPRLTRLVDRTGGV